MGEIADGPVLYWRSAGPTRHSISSCFSVPGRDPDYICYVSHVTDGISDLTGIRLIFTDIKARHILVAIKIDTEDHIGFFFILSSGLSLS
jgi:hypothetical protein